MIELIPQAYLVKSASSFKVVFAHSAQEAVKLSGLTGSIEVQRRTDLDHFYLDRIPVEVLVNTLDLEVPCISCGLTCRRGTPGVYLWGMFAFCGAPCWLACSENSPGNQVFASMAKSVLKKHLKSARPLDAVVLAGGEVRVVFGVPGTTDVFSFHYQDGSTPQLWYPAKHQSLFSDLIVSNSLVQ